MQSMVRSTLSPSTMANFRDSSPISTAVRILFPSLLNITTCDVTRGAAVEISENSRISLLQ